MNDKKQTILEWYRKNQKKIDAPCGGNGVCGKCKVRFQTDAPMPTERELELLSKEEIEEQIRLACLCEMPNEEMEIFQLEGNFWKDKTEVEILAENMPKEYDITTVNDEINSTNNVQKLNEYGIAIDIGTTTLVMSLMNLLTKELIATITELNPQRIYGADVMTRIRAANEGSVVQLQDILKETLEKMFEHILIRNGISQRYVKKITIVGNTTMLHLLCGYSCEGLGRAPFVPVNLAMQKFLAKDCGVKLSEDAVIYIFPGISAFVGADIVAGIYACDMDLEDKVGMLVDIGTNGEMIVGNRQGFIVTSTAAGPVFEGGKIAFGMPAVEGAITHLVFEDGKWKYESLGNTKPKGICGSGLIDLLAELYQNHMIDENGTLSDAYFEEGCLLEEESRIRIFQSDIRELQLGKAAIRAGIEILKNKIMPDYMYLAGAFGGGLRLASAAKIGLFSENDIEYMTAVGNTALEGAKKFLFDKEGEIRLIRISEMAEEIVLAKEAAFEELYIGSMQFEAE